MQIERKGFGYVYQNVMREKTLTPEAKAIYAYLASFAGNNDICFPGVELMMDELQMGRERFYKHMRLLIDEGIVLKEQEKDGSKFSRNTYTINSFPNKQIDEIPQSENKTTENKTSEIPTSGNSTSKSNIFKTNSFNSNSKERKLHLQKHKYGEYKHVLLTDVEKDRLISEFGQDIFDKCIVKLDEYIEMKGYKAQNHNLCIRKWVIKAVQEDNTKNNEKGDRKAYGETYDTGNCYTTEYYKQFATN
jgi:hypothetical protein